MHLGRPYVGYPDTLALDQELQFRSFEWLNLASAAGISIQPSGVESHNAIGVGQRYHAYLRRIYSKVRSSEPLLPLKISLALSIKASNDSAGPSGSFLHSSFLELYQDSLYDRLLYQDTSKE